VIKYFGVNSVDNNILDFENDLMSVDS
jgi:hypothetical protein